MNHYCYHIEPRSCRAGLAYSYAVALKQPANSYFATAARFANLSTVINIYPNPANNMLYLSSTEPLIGSLLILQNVIGQQIAMYDIEAKSINTYQINELPSGIYMAYIKSKATLGNVAKPIKLSILK
jgi:hypothetical protein